jgi:hypothetical protein
MYVDGCNFTTTSFDIGSNITIEIEWPETNLGDTASVPCPCAEFAGSLAGRAYRYCSGTFSQGAHWEKFDDSLCEALSSMTTRRLCAAALLLAQVPLSSIHLLLNSRRELAQEQVAMSLTSWGVPKRFVFANHYQHVMILQDPGRASEVAVEETSTPEDLTPAQVSVSITIVTNITNEVLNNSEV